MAKRSNRQRESLRRALFVEGLEDRRLLAADLFVTKDLLPVQNAPAPVTAGAVVAGLNATYEITVRNLGPDQATNVLVTDIVPTFTTFVSFVQTTGPQFTIAPDPFRPLPLVGQTGPVDAGRATLDPNQEAKFLLTVHVAANTPDTAQVSNTVTVGDPGRAPGPTNDPAPANNLWTVTSDVEIQTDIEVVSTPDKINKLMEGTYFPYTFSILNKGPSDAQNVTFNWTTPNFPGPIPVLGGGNFFGEGGPQYKMVYDRYGPFGTSFDHITGPTFNINTPPRPPNLPRGTYTGSLQTLPAGVGTTYQFWVGTPQQQDFTQVSSGNTSSPDVNSANDTYTDNTHVYDMPLVVQAVQNIQGHAAQTLDLEVMRFIDTIDWSGNNATWPSAIQEGRFNEMFDFNATVDWGDGSAITPASISTDNLGRYHVTGEHVYSAPGAYPVRILVTGDGESTAVGNTVALIGNASRGGAQVGGLKFTENVLETKRVGVYAKGGAAAGTTFTAVINWGDGTPNSAGTMTAVGTTGTYDIVGTHNYVDEGTYNGSITVTGSDGVVDTFPMIVIVDDRAVVGTPINFNAQTNVQKTVDVATFADPGGPKAPGAYAAQIDWGDTTGVTAGIITFNAGTGVFTVQGTHTYTAVGIYPVTITISHGTAPNTVIGAVATVTAGPVGPANPAVNATPGANINAAVNQPATAVVATFTDPAGPDVPANYTAVIDWGDGTPTTTGIITVSGGVFSVTGTHTWTAAGTFPVSVTITHGNSPPATVNLTATVTATPGVGTTTPATINGIEGQVLTSVVVGSFTSTSAAALASDFTATINWGDNTPVTNGTIVKVGAGQFQVKGTHTYKKFGTYPVTVNVKPTGQSATTINSTANIAAAALRGVSVSFSATKNTQFTGKLVASFYDNNTFATTPSAYTAVINWGDGTATSVGTITYNSTTKRFDVKGSHKYTKVSPTGGFKPSITIKKVGSAQQVRVISTATVK